MSSTASLKLYTGDQYRHGAPHEKLRTLPQRTYSMDGSSPDYQNFLKIRDEIDRVLSAANINPISCDLVYRWDSWQKDSRGTITIFIQTKKTNHGAQVVCNVVDLIYARGHDTWVVEIIDRRAIQYTFTPELLPAFEKNWASVEAEILDFIGTDPQWSSMTLLNRGHTRASSAPTVVIGLSEAADGDQSWQSLVLRRVRGILQPYPEVKVSFIRSGLLFADHGKPEPTAVTISPEQALARVSMGASINIGQSGTGTLGGFFKMRNTITEQEHIMGSTCHHVVGDRNSKDPKEFNAIGYPPDINRVSGTIFSPSKTDKDRSVRVWQTIVNSSRDIVDGNLIDLSNPQGARSGGLNFKIAMLGTETDPMTRGDLGRHNNRIARYQQGIAAVNAMDRRLGCIFASSGIDRYDSSAPIETRTSDRGETYTTGTPTDWALLRVHDRNRIMFPNSVSRNDDWVELGYEPTFATVNFANGADIQAGEWLFHKGRNGQYSGIASSVKSTINFSDSEKLWKAWVVIGRKTIEDPSPKSANEEPEKEILPFMYGGDSGTWVLGSNGALRAYGFGGDDESACGYIIPAKNLYREVRAKTGYEIVEPRLIQT